jgi:putative transposase
MEHHGVRLVNPARLHSLQRYQYNPLERILRKIRRRTRVVGSFPDGRSALNLAAARLRHIAGTAWSTKRYLNIEPLKDQQMRGATTA